MRYLNPDTTLMYIDNEFIQQEIYLSTANKYSITGNWDVNIALDYQYNTLNANLVNFVHPKRNTVLAALATAFELHNIKAQASVLETFVFESQTNVKDKKEFTPAIFLSYKPFQRENLNVRAFYKQIFRMPTFNDLYYTDIGNIKLNPEYTEQYNAGIQYDKNFKQGIISHINASADAYYNEVNGKIVAIPKGNGQYRWMMMNLGYVEIRGIDISAQVEWAFPESTKLNTSLNYTHQKAQEFTDPKSPWYGGQIAYIPKHNGSAIANITRKTIEINYSFIYVGKRYHNSANIRENFEQPWYTHDLTVSKAFLLNKNAKIPPKLKLSAEVNNIFNQQYDVVLNYPMPGVNFKIIIKLTI
jgi:outer membrane receptor protein involved in Fe transport